eukprot:jgi/Tetstr1/458775/TSEL_045159.t1
MSDQPVSAAAAVRTWWLQAPGDTRAAICGASFDGMHLGRAAWLCSSRGGGMCKRHARAAWRVLGSVEDGNSFLLEREGRVGVRLAADLVQREGGDALLDALAGAGLLSEEEELAEWEELSGEEEDDVRRCLVCEELEEDGEEPDPGTLLSMTEMAVLKLVSLRLWEAAGVAGAPDVPPPPPAHPPAGQAAPPSGPEERRRGARARRQRAMERALLQEWRAALPASDGDDAGGAADSPALPAIAYDDAICAICHALLHRPVTTRCNHTFCAACIEHFMEARSRWQSEFLLSGLGGPPLGVLPCPMCRTATVAAELLAPAEELRRRVEASFPAESAERAVEAAREAAERAAAAARREAAARAAEAGAGDLFHFPHLLRREDIFEDESREDVQVSPDLQPGRELEQSFLGRRPPQFDRLRQLAELMVRSPREVPRQAVPVAPLAERAAAAAARREAGAGDMFHLSRRRWSEDVSVDEPRGDMEDSLPEQMELHPELRRPSNPGDGIRAALHGLVLRHRRQEEALRHDVPVAPARRAEPRAAQRQRRQQDAQAQALQRASRHQQPQQRRAGGNGGGRQRRR